MEMKDIGFVQFCMEMRGTGFCTVLHGNERIGFIQFCMEMKGICYTVFAWK